jgi:single-stranded-DNA-specific exonuclease
MIFWDYDVDGISSTAALFLFLRDELGMDVSYRLPHRVHDGYGIKSYHMDEIATTGTRLVITVDCGTKDKEPIEHAAYTLNGCHRHRSSFVSRSSPSLYRCCESSSELILSILSQHSLVQELSGKWFTLSLISFSQKKHRGFYILQKYVDIVSLGTVADCMPMQDENRTIVRRGILQSQQSHHPFFQTFSGALNRPILTEEDIGFFVGPLLNAGGRITTPHQSLSTLLASSLDSFSRIQELIGCQWDTKREVARCLMKKRLPWLIRLLRYWPILIQISNTAYSDSLLQKSQNSIINQVLFLRSMMDIS